MTKERYYELMDQLGTEPDPEKVPVEVQDLPLSFQAFMQVFAYLPDRWDGMSGTYLGKDLSPLDTILDIFEVRDKRLALQAIHVLETKKIKQVNSKRKSKAPKKPKK